MKDSRLLKCEECDKMYDAVRHYYCPKCAVRDIQRKLKLIRGERY